DWCGAHRPRSGRGVRGPHLRAGAPAAALHGGGGARAASRSRAAGAGRRGIGETRAARRRGARAGGTGVSRARAVVFAYHDVGVRCLKTVLSAGVEVALVVTVPDDPQETHWYASVAATAADYGLSVIAPAEPDAGELERTLEAL